MKCISSKLENWKVNLDLLKFIKVNKKDENKNLRNSLKFKMRNFTKTLKT